LEVGFVRSVYTKQPFTELSVKSRHRLTIASGPEIYFSGTSRPRPTRPGLKPARTLSTRRKNACHRDSLR
jgi:hypothetical protein